MMIILYYQVAVKFALYILLYENWHIVEREPCIIDLVRGGEAWASSTSTVCIDRDVIFSVYHSMSNLRDLIIFKVLFSIWIITIVQY